MKERCHGDIPRDPCPVAGGGIHRGSPTSPEPDPVPYQALGGQWVATSFRLAPMTGSGSSFDVVGASGYGIDLTYFADSIYYVRYTS